MSSTLEQFRRTRITINTPDEIKNFHDNIGLDYFNRDHPYAAIHWYSEDGDRYWIVENQDGTCETILFNDQPTGTREAVERWIWEGCICEDTSMITRYVNEED